MDFPLLLAGPILRRVESNLVSVWVALSQPADITLSVWEDLVVSGKPDPYATSEPTSAIRVGDKLYLALVAIRVPATGKSFAAGALYSYDLRIKLKTTQAEHTLATLGMLEDGAANGSRKVALGLSTNMLPSFATSPDRLAELNILYGSCRKTGHNSLDALAMVDDLIFQKDRYKDPKTRPHQLFLGGDQIYADDVSVTQMLLVMARAPHLIGVKPDPSNPEAEDGVLPVEHVTLNQISIMSHGVDVGNPGAAYELETVAADETVEHDIPVDRLHFPEGQRLATTQRDAQFTSTDGSSHIISLGEFASLYLTVWSNALWGEELPVAKFKADKTSPETSIRWDTPVPETGQIIVPKFDFPRRAAPHLYVPLSGDDLKNYAAMTPEEREAERQRIDDERQPHLRREIAILQEFYRTLPNVQRALANVPTYMILDDHDVTDDFFLNPAWRDRVLSTGLGQCILHNAMVAYALFQDWGNDPLKYDAGKPAELLQKVTQLFPAPPDPRAGIGPDPEVRRQISQMLGHEARNKPLADGTFEAVKPDLTWHFMVDGPKHRVVAIDNRTRRSYVSINGPPGNVAIDALADQLPAAPLPGDREILIVVAPLQVIGPPVLDEIVAPASYKLFDLGGMAMSSPLSATSETGHRGMTGTDPDAIEAWAFDSITFEHLLSRLAPYERVVLLSGDVHYSAATLMSYWRGKDDPVAHIAQFTSSGMKNVMPPMITFANRALGFVQQLARANIAIERLGWKEPKDDLILYPTGKSEFDLSPGLRAKLQATPVLAPTWGWPQGSRVNPQRPPDWRWRVQPLLDIREDAKPPEGADPEGYRPEGAWLLPLDEADIDTKLADNATVLTAYRKIAERHQYALKRLRNTRQIMFRSNVGQVRFATGPGGALDAVHKVYTVFSPPGPPAPAHPEPYMVQVAHFGPKPTQPSPDPPISTEEPPELLREKALFPLPEATS